MNSDRETIDLVLMIQNWYQRLSKDMNTAPSYIFKDTIKVIKEMKEFLKVE